VGILHRVPSRGAIVDWSAFGLIVIAVRVAIMHGVCRGVHRILVRYVTCHLHFEIVILYMFPSRDPIFNCSAV
jgi:hypothetical protein